MSDEYQSTSPLWWLLGVIPLGLATLGLMSLQNQSSAPDYGELRDQRIDATRRMMVEEHGGQVADGPLLSDDGRVRMTLPSGYVSVDQNPGATLEACATFTDRCVFVSTEPRFMQPISLDEYAEGVTQNLVEYLGNGRVLSPGQRLTVGGYPAVRSELFGGMAGMRGGQATWVLTVIETETNFHLVNAVAGSVVQVPTFPMYSLTDSFREAAEQPTSDWIVSQIQAGPSARLAVAPGWRLRLPRSFERIENGEDMAGFHPLEVSVQGLLGTAAEYADNAAASPDLTLLETTTGTIEAGEYVERIYREEEPWPRIYLERAVRVGEGNAVLLTAVSPEIYWDDMADPLRSALDTLAASN